MRRILILALLIAPLIPPISRAENRLTLQSAVTEIKPTNKARAGFYLGIKRSAVSAYPGWQGRTIALLRRRRFRAFNGDPKNQIGAHNIVTLESLEQTAEPSSVISAVYVGPYRSRQAAEHVIPKLLSALKPLTDDELKHWELKNRHLFLVGTVRVK